MVFKIIGTVLVLTGIVLVAKFKLFAPGLILIGLGFFLGMKLGMKPE